MDINSPVVQFLRLRMWLFCERVTSTISLTVDSLRFFGFRAVVGASASDGDDRIEVFSLIVGIQLSERRG